MNLAAIASDKSPYIHVVEGIAQVAYDAARKAVRRTHGSDYAVEVRFVRGTKMATTQELYDEFAAALQFPPGFGRNWDALRDAVADLGWIDRSNGLALIVLDAGEMMEGESEKAFANFAEVARSVVEDVTLKKSPDGPKRVQLVFVVPTGGAAAFRKRLGV